MKHAHVLATLTAGERIAPWAMPVEGDSDPLPADTRVQRLVCSDGRVRVFALRAGRLYVRERGER